MRPIGWGPGDCRTSEPREAVRPVALRAGSPPSPIAQAISFGAHRAGLWRQREGGGRCARHPGIPLARPLCPTA